MNRVQGFWGSRIQISMKFMTSVIYMSFLRLRRIGNLSSEGFWTSQNDGKNFRISFDFIDNVVELWTLNAGTC